jgi:hypothetical protein
MLPTIEIGWAVLRTYGATHEEITVLSACPDTRPASARRGSAALSCPGAEQEFLGARHSDVQQPPFFARSASGRGTMPSSSPATIVARTVRPLEPIIVMMRTP